MVVRQKPILQKLLFHIGCYQKRGERRNGFRNSLENRNSMMKISAKMRDCMKKLVSVFLSMIVLLSMIVFPAVSENGSSQSAGTTAEVIPTETFPASTIHPVLSQEKKEPFRQVQLSLSRLEMGTQSASFQARPVWAHGNMMKYPNPNCTLLLSPERKSAPCTCSVRNRKNACTPRSKV